MHPTQGSFATGTQAPYRAPAREARRSFSDRARRMETIGNRTNATTELALAYVHNRSFIRNRSNCKPPHPVPLIGHPRVSAVDRTRLPRAFGSPGRRTDPRGGTGWRLLRPEAAGARSVLGDPLPRAIPNRSAAGRAFGRRSQSRLRPGRGRTRDKCKRAGVSGGWHVSCGSSHQPHQIW